MKIKAGQDRLVVVMPEIGIAVKIPIVHIWLAMKMIRNDGWECLRHSAAARHSPRYYLFKGIIANWSEFTFYQKTRNPFVQVTYFSLVGMFNIVRVDDPCQLDKKILRKQLYEITEGAISRDGHHFNNPDNFCFRDGKLKMLDYGSPATQQIATKYGESIREKFRV